jgi:hypothetical protein
VHGSIARPDEWTVGRANVYVQVAVAGKAFDRIEGDNDINRLFRVMCAFDDAELIGLVETLRFNREVERWPLLSVVRQRQDLVLVMLRGGANRGQAVT